jgi:hypothetical protein
MKKNYFVQESKTAFLETFRFLKVTWGKAGLAFLK